MILQQQRGSNRLKKDGVRVIIMNVMSAEIVLLLNR